MICMGGEGYQAGKWGNVWGNDDGGGGEEEEMRLLNSFTVDLFPTAVVKSTHIVSISQKLFFFFFSKW